MLERFTEDQARYVFRQILSAVTYLLTMNILHRDIKDENILIDQNFNVKLIDFGSACFTTQSGDGLFLGTLQYAAPEIVEGRASRGSPCEIWSLGCCLFIMVTGESPFETIHDVRMSPPPFSRTRGNGGVSGGSGKLSHLCQHLISWMLEKDPAKRPSVQQVLQHPWLAGRA
ncbi:hypothetical protein HDU76_006211 [Blyttiomyces sp. JEL0837]|nr:hypothetical protein HDU76_006211 [Blyttiomyces sp. JEL0837]